MRSLFILIKHLNYAVTHKKFTFKIPFTGQLIFFLAFLQKEGYIQNFEINNNFVFVNLKIKNNSPAFQKIIWYHLKNKETFLTTKKFNSLTILKPNSVFLVSNSSGLKFITIKDMPKSGRLICEIY